MAEEKSQPAKDALLDDLESIRTALEKDRREAASSADQVEQAPVATPDESSEEHPPPQPDDVTHGGSKLDEIAPSRSNHVDDLGDGLDDALLEALLGDHWKRSASELLEAGRAEIEAHRNHWVPEDTDKLNEALRERIDTTLQQWLRALVSRNLDDLRQALLAAVAAELKSRIQVVLTRDGGSTAQGNDENDG